MSSRNRYAGNALPAGAEDDDDSDEDIWCSSRPSAQPLSQPLAVSVGNVKNDPYSDICTLPNGNQRSSFGAAAPGAPQRSDQQTREAAVEDFRMSIAADRIDAAISMLESLDPKSVSRSGWTPLMYAVEAGQEMICQKLLDMGSDPNHHIDNFSVLMAACRCRREGVAANLVKMLIESHGVFATDAKDRYHSTPLMYAAMEGNVDVVKYLLEICKVPVDSYDARGHTALMLAVRKGQLETSRTLLSLGADPEKMNVEGKTAKDMSMDSGNVAVINLLNNDKSIRVSALDSYNEVSRYGEMESFFFGLQLHELIDVFKEQKVEFRQLLLLSEADLTHLGVKMGDVKKVSEAIHAIHKQPWNKSSLHKFDPKTRNILKCSESVAVVENIGKHASLMCSSIGYVTDQIKTHAAVLESGIDNGAALKLHTSTNEAAANCRALLNEINRLSDLFRQSDLLKDVLPVDKIDQAKSAARKSRGKSKWLRIVVGLGLGTILVVGLAIGAGQLAR